MKSHYRHDQNRYLGIFGAIAWIFCEEHSSPFFLNEERRTTPDMEENGDRVHLKPMRNPGNPYRSTSKGRLSGLHGHSGGAKSLSCLALRRHLKMKAVLGILQVAPRGGRGGGFEYNVWSVKPV